MKKNFLISYLLLLNIVFSEVYNDRFLIYIENSIKDFQLDKTENFTNDHILNQFLNDSGTEKIVKWLPNAKETDRDGQVYLNRFYVIKLLKESEDINTLVDKVVELYCIERAEIMNIIKTEYIPNDPYWSNQWFLPNIGADLAFDLWDISSGQIPGYSEDNPIVVGVVDVGLDWDHPDLIENIWQNLGEDIDGDGVVIIQSGNTWIFDPGDINGIDDDGDGYVDNFIGWDVSNNDNDPVPPSGLYDHGTMVAGCVSASTDNGTGISSVGWGVEIMGINSSDDYEVVTDAGDGLLTAAQMGADIINLSLGYMGSCGSWQNLVNTVYNNYGCIIIASSGNGGENGYTNFDLHSPSSCNNVISVTATDPVDQFDCWATAGETVDISAPGWQIRTTDVGGGYTYTQGTSFSSPIVAGAAALLKSRFPNSSNADIEDLILNNTDQFSDMTSSCQGTSLVGMLGSGRLNIYNSLVVGESSQGPSLYISDVNYLNDTDGDGVFNPGEQIKIKLVVGNELGFLDAENVIVTISTDDERIAFLDNIITFSNIIESGATAFTLLDHFLVYAFDDADLGDIPCVLNIQSGVTEPYDTEQISINIKLSLNQAGYPVGEIGVESSPIIMNLDGNGSSEVFFGDEEGNLNVYTSGGYSQFGFPFESGDKIRSSPAVADLDGDGTNELVFGSHDGSLYVLSPFGSVLLEYPQEGEINGSPALIDLDQDGDKEIIFTTQNSNSGMVYAIHHNGENCEGFPLNINERMVSGAAAGDLEGDGNPDIVVSTWDDNIYAIDNLGNIKTGFPVSSTNRFNISPTLVDLDFDGDLEIVIGNDSGLLHVLHHNGVEMVSYDVGDDIRGGVSVADINNDGSLELLFSGYDDLLHIWNPIENIELEGWPVDLNSNSVSEPMTADLDNDGDLEIIAATKTGFLFIFHHDGTNFNGFPSNLNENIESSPAIGDLDDDGDYEIAIGTSTGLYVFDIKTQKGEIPSWRLHRGNIERTGSLGFTMVEVDDELINLPTKFYVSSNYPNPFNPSTKIDVTIVESNNLRVDIFDAKGHLINTLINKNVNPGSYTLNWSAEDQKGIGISTGIFFIRVQSGKNTSTQKVLLIK